MTSTVQSLSANIPVNSCAPISLFEKLKFAIVHSSTLVELSLPIACMLSGLENAELLAAPATNLASDKGSLTKKYGKYASFW
jgi:hypothetical protein